MTRDRKLHHAGLRTWGLVILLLLLAPATALADWEVYVGGGLGISFAEGNAIGSEGPTPTPATIGGKANDGSPMLEGFVGLEIPMDELVPRELLLDVRLPDWPVRVELEAAGLREYELRNFLNTDLFFTEIETTTLFLNAWVDVPMTSLYRPIQYTFGLGRQPRVRQWLEPASLFVGVGVGYAHTDFAGTSNSGSASNEFDDFAWNAGVGVNYALTDAVDLSAGYRFTCFAGEQCMAHNEGFELTPTGGGTNATDYLEYDLMAHEIRVQVRVEVFEFQSPW